MIPWISEVLLHQLVKLDNRSQTECKPCDAQIEGIEVAGTNASVSALDFLSSTSSLAIGNEYGLVIFFSFCVHLCVNV